MISLKAMRSRWSFLPVGNFIGIEFLGSAHIINNYNVGYFRKLLETNLQQTETKDT